MHNLVTKATYSPEDNKLRIYLKDTDERFEEETYQKLKKHGFKYAPVQRLFVAPRWTPSREDLCIELGDEIVSDEITMLERAEAKAKRLDDLSDKRIADSSIFIDAAKNCLAGIVEGQPILIGHHSERKHRKAIDSSDKFMEKAVIASKAANYWSYRAEGVERHANRKNDCGVRVRRIEKLYADLRGLQRDLNHGHIVFDLWSDIDKSKGEKRDNLTKYYVSIRLASGPTAPQSFYSALKNGEITVDEVIEKSKKWATQIVTNVERRRMISHILNRLDYERFMLGDTPRFEGELTATILKAFVRKNGAEKPTCKLENGKFVVSSEVPLPMHIAEGRVLSLSNEDWANLMQRCGYVVPMAKPATPPILNFEAENIEVMLHSKKQKLRQISLTKKEYSSLYQDYRGVKPSSCGNFRVKIALDPTSRATEFWSREWVCVFLNDSKVHDCPDSDAVKLKSEEE